MKNVKVIPLTLGIAATNCYILADAQNGGAVVIDPSAEAKLLIETAQQAGLQICLILATHGHYDHVGAAAELVALSGAPFMIHELSPALAESPPDGFAGQLFPPIPVPQRRLGDDETLICGQIRLRALFTPGHAPDHLCFWWEEEKILFGGDCLFAGGIGRTDLPLCDHDTLMRSITRMLDTYPSETLLLPGHMGPTTLARERRDNPWLRELPPLDDKQT